VKKESTISRCKPPKVGHLKSDIRQDGNKYRNRNQESFAGLENKIRERGRGRSENRLGLAQDRLNRCPNQYVEK
jgi:hypothetical protein